MSDRSIARAVVLVAALLASVPLGAQMRWAVADQVEATWGPGTPVGTCLPIGVQGLATATITVDDLGGGVSDGWVEFWHRQDATHDVWNRLTGTFGDVAQTDFRLNLIPYLAPDKGMGWRFPVSALYEVKICLRAPIVGGALLVRLNASAAPSQPATVVRQGDPARLRSKVTW